MSHRLARVYWSGALKRTGLECRLPPLPRPSCEILQAAAGRSLVLRVDRLATRSHEALARILIQLSLTRRPNFDHTRRTSERTYVSTRRNDCDAGCNGPLCPDFRFSGSPD